VIDGVETRVVDDRQRAGRPQRRALSRGPVMAAANVRAVTSFVTEIKGVERLVHAGDVLAAGDPVARARPELFETADKPGAA
jgi:hypothetical protein